MKVERFILRGVWVVFFEAAAAAAAAGEGSEILLLLLIAKPDAYIEPLARGTTTS